MARPPSPSALDTTTRFDATSCTVVDETLIGASSIDSFAKSCIAKTPYGRPTDRSSCFGVRLRSK
jgi:hypothetical protein